MSTCGDNLGPSIDETFMNPTFLGTVTLGDAASKLSLATQLCVPMNKCITDAVKQVLEDESESLKVANLAVSNSIALTDKVQKQLLDALQDKLQPYVEKSLEGGEIVGAVLADSLIRNCTFDGDSLRQVLNFMVDPITAASFYANTCQYMANCVKNNVDSHTFNDVTLAGATLNTPTITGATVSQTVLSGNTFHTNSFTGEFILDAAANASLCSAIQTCVNAWINAAFTELMGLLDAEIARSTAKDAEHDTALADHDGRLKVLEECKPGDLLDVHGDPIKCKPIVTEDNLKEILSALKTCEGELGSEDCPDSGCLQRIVTCTEMLKAINDQPSCEGVVEGQPVVRCDELDGQIRNLLKTCSNEPLGIQTIASCADLNKVRDDLIALINALEIKLANMINAINGCNFIHPAADNLIQCRDGKLFYGIAAEVGAYFVDAINGNDQNPGTRQLPMQNAITAYKRIPPGTTNVIIYLHENQTHIIRSTERLGGDGKPCSYGLETYGPTCDALSTLWHSSPMSWPATGAQQWPRATILAVSDATVAAYPGEVFGWHIGVVPGHQASVWGVNIEYPRQTNPPSIREWRGIFFGGGTCRLVDSTINNHTDMWALRTTDTNAAGTLIIHSCAVAWPTNPIVECHSSGMLTYQIGPQWAAGGVSSSGVPFLPCTSANAFATTYVTGAQAKQFNYANVNINM